MFLPPQLRRCLPSTSKPIPIPLLLTTFVFLLGTAAYLSFDLSFSTPPLSLEDQAAQLELDLLLPPNLLSETGGRKDLFGSDGEFKRDRETKWIGGIPGWSSFENLYFMGGRFIALTTNSSSIPPVDTLLTDMPFDILSPEEASTAWYDDQRDLAEPRRINELRGGTTFMARSGWGGTTYYYHFVAEVFAGLVYLFTSTSKRFVLPRRMINSGDQWKGFHGGLNEWFMESLAPKTQMLDGDVWTEMSDSGQLFVFDEISVFDRWTAHRHNEQAQLWNKAMGGLYDILPPRDHWWEPVRQQMQSVLRLKGHSAAKAVPKVVYVSRQPSWHRKLIQEDHDSLVSTLKATPGINFQVAEFENMSPAEQISLALQTDIMIGVHGSGLTHEVWMRNGSSLIEIFDAESFIRDYQMVAAPLGFNYFPIHNDTIYDWKTEAKSLLLGPDFSGSSIRVYAPTIEDLVLELVASK
ncbi:hypothetical protein BDY24DRAFT_386122 [Mrakia frigida]|uniref:uncharacterized protein n=1 Tax=Mrakia frigida TaxID=29902 RepID=UPI003FCC0C22